MPVDAAASGTVTPLCSPPMSSEQTPKEASARARRMSTGGKLSFRRRVPHVDTEGLPLVIGGDEPPALPALVPAGYRSVEIEVGPGKGAFLCAATAARPDTFFVGIEAAASYASYAAAQLQLVGARNAVLLVDNAVLYLRDSVPPASLDRLHVYFPDPWPKRRHRGRRFFGEGSPALAHRVLKPGGLLLLATDNPAYAGQICRVLGASPLLARDADAEIELPALGPGHGFSPTNFERKYLEEGRVIRRYAFRRIDQPA
jgi:tRNA (guanine-N7-)-methyltransferase